MPKTTKEHVMPTSAHEDTHLFTFRLPDPGEGLASAELVEWIVAEQQSVVVDEPLLTVETAKATVEISAPVTGKVVRFFAAQGSIVSVGDPLLELEVDDDSAAGVRHLVGRIPDRADTPVHRLPQKPSGSAPKVTPAVRRLARSLNVSLTSVTGTGPGDLITAEDVEHAASQGSEVL
jgi:2-oxoisovalerate dehydrogenase E2 component (dihydrolipoyl transacylase)